MRFGKKLALQVTDDQSGAPYLSHKNMKEAINKTVRQLRLYQSKVQSTEQPWRGGALQPETATAEEIAELEAQVTELDQQLFELVDDDLARILAHIRNSETVLEQHIAALQASALQLGMLMDEAQALQLEKSIPVPPESRTLLCQKLLELRMRSEPAEVKAQLVDIGSQYNAIVDAANKHTQYLEINVAGFRKLLKRHEKQIPQRFHTRPTPFLGFHRLIKHTSRQLVEIVRQLGCTLEDACVRLAQVTRETGFQLELHELKGFGAECQMVLEIQKQLKAVPHMSLLAGGALEGSAPCPFLKPGSEIVSASAVQAQNSKQHQQPLHQQQQHAPPYAGPQVWWPPPDATPEQIEMILHAQRQAMGMQAWTADSPAMPQDGMWDFLKKQSA